MSSLLLSDTEVLIGSNEAAFGFIPAVEFRRAPTKAGMLVGVNSEKVAISSYDVFANDLAFEKIGKVPVRLPEWATEAAEELRATGGKPSLGKIPDHNGIHIQAYYMAVAVLNSGDFVLL